MMHRPFRATIFSVAAGGFLAGVMLATTGVPRAQTPDTSAKAVLYEESRQTADGLKFSGQTRWRAVAAEPKNGRSAGMAVRADVHISDRQLKLILLLERNADPNIPASHTLELQFQLQRGSPIREIANVPGWFAKSAEGERGTPFSGHGVKVSRGRFLIGLSSSQPDMERNVELLTREWFDIPLVYGSKTRAVLAIEKGSSGQAAFAEAPNILAGYVTPKAMCEQLGKPSIGMTRAEIDRTCWGPPTRTYRTTTAAGVTETLVYRSGQLVLRDGRLVEISEAE